MNSLLEQPVFNWRHNQAFRGIINRSNRRRYMKLSRTGRLRVVDLPIWMLGQPQ